MSIVDPINLAVADADDNDLTRATVTLTNRPDDNAESILADTSGTTIVQSYDPATGVLSLVGRAPKSDYQRVLRTVNYNNTSQAPTGGSRQVTFVVNDGTANSNAATSAIQIAAG